MTKCAEPSRANILKGKSRWTNENVPQLTTYVHECILTGRTNLTCTFSKALCKDEFVANLIPHTLYKV